jgi:hypothetical protein
MSAFSAHFSRGFRWFVPALLACALAGCATQKVNWAARVGVYTFDQAVLELGPPDNHAKLTDGTVVADWLTSRRGAYPYIVGGYPMYPGWYTTPGIVSYSATPDWYLRLTFGPEGKLQSWKKFAK